MGSLIVMKRTPLTQDVNNRGHWMWIYGNSLPRINEQLVPWTLDCNLYIPFPNKKESGLLRETAYYDSEVDKPGASCYT